MAYQRLDMQNIHSCRLKPAGRPFAPLALNALDHLEVLFNMEIVYFYCDSLDARRLKASLTKALADFPFLAGQLVRNKSRLLSVQDTALGVLFSEDTCGAKLEELTDGIHTRYNAGSFISRINPLRLTNKNHPLATFRLTHLNGGGSALGICISHAMADGFSFFQFINHWARIHAGQSGPRPLHERGLLYSRQVADASPDAVQNQTRECAGFHRHSHLSLARLIAAFMLKQRSVVCRVLRFSSAQLNAIKKAAEAESPDRVSLNDALCAHLWRFCVNIGGLPPDRGCRLLLPINIRRLTGHPRADDYFGNAVAHMILKRRGSDIARPGTAADCRKAVSAIDAGHVCRQMRWLKHQENSGRLYRVTAALNCYAGDVIIGSLF
ncbi:MAG: hypothetical protein GY868_17040, partial [Deltaproteobacteria bacterium]|nr:hypothetical protein [Deltaproteobacteria bacterium]MCP4716831.1 hypothetical protein [Deltaproteobacteria bacterium]